MDFRASLQVWRRVLMQPGEAGFAEELAKPYARWGTAVIWLFGAGLVSVLVWLLIFLLLDPNLDKPEPKCSRRGAKAQSFCIFSASLRLCARFLVHCTRSSLERYYWSIADADARVFRADGRY